MASIRDVAKRANVGAMTVSRYLNGTGYVSEVAAEKIKIAVQELDYTPNELARNLFHKKTGIVAVLLPDISHPFFSKFVKCVEIELYEKGYKTMICSTVKEHNCELEYLDMLKRHMVDGIITGVHSLGIEEYLKIDKPIVALDRNLGEKIPVVGVDHRSGGRIAAQRLVDCGCKNVIQFEGALVVDSPSNECHSTFLEVMEQNHVSVCSYELEWNRFDEKYFKETVHRVFEKYPEIDGVFGADMLAVFYLKEALQAGKKVPEDIKIVAYDGTYITEVTSPSITAVVQPIEMLAIECVKLVLELAEGKEYRNKRVVLDVKLSEGGTT